MKHLINNTTKQVFGFDDSQENLYQSYKDRTDYQFIDCRLPNQFEEWDSKNYIWVINEELKASTYKQNQLTLAKQQLDQSIKLESGVYQRKMSEEQKQDFKDWQDSLLEFINGERQDMPEQPNFVINLIENI